MKPHALEAEVFRLLLINGFVESSEIIAWADQKIVEDSKPSDELIEISIAEPGNRSALLSHLSQLAEGADKFAALRAVLGRMYESASTMNSADLASLADVLSNIPTENAATLPEDLTFLLGLNDKFALAKDQKIGDLPTISKDFVEKLHHFRDLVIS